jgi:hypothetical protein
MNRIVIVGNGFDLTHGLLSGYEHFLLDYFKSSLMLAQESDGYEFKDQLIKVVCNEVPVLAGGKNVWELIDSYEILMNSPYISWPPSEFENLKFPDQVLNAMGIEKRNFTIEIISEFFDDLIEEKNWTDIERHYFNFLCKKYNKNEFYDIEELNKDFQFIQDKLIVYLKEITSSSSIQPTNNRLRNFINRCFGAIDDHSFKMKFPLMKGGILMTDSDRNPGTICFLNFNYTDILNSYIQNNPAYNRAYHYQIHGNIDTPSSVVFGYGDDTHKHYKELEDADVSELLINMKAFYYPSNSHYGNLINFIELDNFEVFVVGHSLGLSDRVLLKTIFESDNCRAIRLFHRGTEKGHFYKRIALSRHFDDKISMRKKIVDYDANDCL